MAVYSLFIVRFGESEIEWTWNADLRSWKADLKAEFLPVDQPRNKAIMSMVDSRLKVFGSLKKKFTPNSGCRFIECLLFYSFCLLFYIVTLKTTTTKLLLEMFVYVLAHWHVTALIGIVTCDTSWMHQADPGSVQTSVISRLLCYVSQKMHTQNFSQSKQCSC